MWLFAAGVNIIGSLSALSDRLELVTRGVQDNSRPQGWLGDRRQ